MSDARAILLQTGGLVLAGGLSRRFGAEKATAVLNGRTLTELAADKLEACAAVAISAPPHGAAAAVARANGYDLVADDMLHPSGPLAGVHAGLAWAEARELAHLAVLPCDAPLVPTDIVAQLASALGEATAVFATTADGDHPLCALWRVALRAPLADALTRHRHPPVHAFLETQGARRLRFDDAFAFVNINTAADLDAVKRKRASKP